MTNRQSNQIKSLFGAYGVLEIEPIEKTFKFQCLCSAITITQSDVPVLDAKTKQNEPKTFSLDDKKQYSFFIQFNQKTPIDWKCCDHISINYRSDWIKDKRLSIILYHPVVTKIGDFFIEGSLCMDDVGYYDYWIEEK